MITGDIQWKLTICRLLQTANDEIYSDISCYCFSQTSNTAVNTLVTKLTFEMQTLFYLYRRTADMHKCICNIHSKCTVVIIYIHCIIVQNEQITVFQFDICVIICCCM